MALFGMGTLYPGFGQRKYANDWGYQFILCLPKLSGTMQYTRSGWYYKSIAPTCRRKSLLTCRNVGFRTLLTCLSPILLQCSPRTFRIRSGCQPSQVRGSRRGVLVHCPPNAEELVWVPLRGDTVGTGITSFRKDPDDGGIRSPTVCG